MFGRWSLGMSIVQNTYRISYVVDIYNCEFHHAHVLAFTLAAYLMAPSSCKSPIGKE